jgi:hypothetical protein
MAYSSGGLEMEQGQIQDTLDQIFTGEELGQIVSALRNSWFDLKNGGQQSDDLLHIETALQKIGWVIDEEESEGIRTLRDYEL